MQPCMSTVYLWRTAAHAAIERLAEHGWRNLELHYSHASELLKTGDPARVGDRFRRFAADRGVRFPQGHLYAAQLERDGGGPRWFDVAPSGDAEFARAIDDMRRWIDFFDALQIEAGVLHIGGFALKDQGWSHERILARRVEALAALAAHAQGGQMVICVENLPFPGSGVRTIDEILEITSAVSSRAVGICLDTGHANVAGADCPAFIEEAGAQLRALHVNDNNGKDDVHMLPYARGTIAWDRVMQALRAVGYRGCLNFEVPGEILCPQEIQMAKLDYALRVAEWMIACEGEMLCTT